MTSKQQRKHQQRADRAIRKAQMNRDRAREKLLQQRKRLARRRERNVEATESTEEDDSASLGTNPTAYSTVPRQRSNAENSARQSHSTVPLRPKYSTVRPRARLYGLRLQDETVSRETPKSDGMAGQSPEADATVGATDE